MRLFFLRPCPKVRQVLMQLNTTVPSDNVGNNLVLKGLKNDMPVLGLAGRHKRWKNEAGTQS